MNLDQFSSDVLNAFEGICYVTDPDGDIVSIGPDNWTEFAISNDAGSLMPDRLIGRNYLDFVQDDAVKEHFNECLSALAKSDFDEWVQPYRCDAPAVKREMRLSIKSIDEDSVVLGYLFQSIQLSAINRPPLDIFDFPALNILINSERDLSIVKMCSFCQNVSSEEYTSGEWKDAEKYYRAGGHSNVRLSHGICDSCTNMASTKVS